MDKEKNGVMQTVSRFVVDEIISSDEMTNEMIVKVHATQCPETKLNVSVQDYQLSAKEPGTEFEGVLAVVYVQGFSECSDSSLNFKLQYLVGVSAAVEVIDIAGDDTVYARTYFHDKPVRVEFEKAVHPKLNSIIGIRGELHVEE